MSENGTGAQSAESAKQSAQSHPRPTTEAPAPASQPTGSGPADEAAPGAGKAWLVYTLLRLALFALPFAVIYLVAQGTGMSQLIAAALAAVLAAMVSWALSVLLLRRYREAASESVWAWRNSRRSDDELQEDAALGEE